MSEGANLELGGSPSDRRKFPRIEIATNVSYAVIIPAYELGSTKDISEGGMCLEMKRKMALGTILRLEFELPGDKPEHIEALGRIMWQRPKADETYSTGIKFLT